MKVNSNVDSYACKSFCNIVTVSEVAVVLDAEINSLDVKEEEKEEDVDQGL
jgi:hypothetical protein